MVHDKVRGGTGRGKMGPDGTGGTATSGTGQDGTGPVPSRPVPPRLVPSRPVPSLPETYCPHFPASPIPQNPRLTQNSTRIPVPQNSPKLGPKSDSQSKTQFLFGVRNLGHDSCAKACSPTVGEHTCAQKSWPRFRAPKIDARAIGKGDVDFAAGIPALQGTGNRISFVYAPTEELRCNHDPEGRAGSCGNRG